MGKNIWREEAEARGREEAGDRAEALCPAPVAVRGGSLNKFRVSGRAAVSGMDRGGQISNIVEDTAEGFLVIYRPPRTVSGPQDRQQEDSG